MVLFQGSLSRSSLHGSCFWLYSLFLSVLCILYRRLDANNNFVISKWLFATPIVFGLLGAVFSGWLADAKLGNYRVMKYSFVLLFLISLFSSACTLVPDIAHHVYVVSVFYCIGESVSIIIVAVVACFVTSLQLGLDQMPDASHLPTSSSNMTSLLPSLYSVSMLVFGSLMFPICLLDLILVMNYRTGLSNFTV